MSIYTSILSGSFTSTGQNFNINMPCGVNWMQVWNLTAITNGSVDSGFKWEWNLGMGGIEYQSNGDVSAVTILPRPNDFIPFNSSLNNPLGPVAITASTNAVRPVVSTASTAGLAAGSVVKLVGVTGQPNLSSYDFTIDTVVANTSFRVAFALANVPGAAGTAGFYRIVPFNPIFYPSRRFVVNISQAAQAQVTTSVAHNLTVGQAVRFYVWSQESNIWGMTQIDQLIGNITSIVDAGNFTVDIDTTAFSAFTFPGAAAYPFTRAQVVPVGEQANATASDPNLITDAVVNTAEFGITLVAGVNSPGGAVGNIMYWLAGNVDNA